MYVDATDEGVAPPTDRAPDFLCPPASPPHSRDTRPAGETDRNT